MTTNNVIVGDMGLFLLNPCFGSLRTKLSLSASLIIKAQLEALARLLLAPCRLPLRVLGQGLRAAVDLVPNCVKLRERNHSALQNQFGLILGDFAEI